MNNKIRESAMRVWLALEWEADSFNQWLEKQKLAGKFWGG